MKKDSEEVEIERKWLLWGIPKIRYDEVIRISQCYKKDSPERIRSEEVFMNPGKPFQDYWLKENSRNLFTRTKKIERKDGLGVIEKNTSLNEKEFNDLLSSFPNRVEKIRHVKRVSGGLKWEIDDFSAHNTKEVSLIIAELEVSEDKHKNFKIDFPGWLKPFIMLEVTGMNQFYNFELAKKDF